MRVLMRGHVGVVVGVVVGTIIALLTPETARAQGASGVISGRVTDSVTASAVAYASVIAERENGGVGGTARTSADGAYRIVGLEPGAYTVRILSIGYTPFTTPAVRVGAEPVTLNVALPRVNILEQVVVTTTRGATAEKVLAAPASISVVPQDAIATRPSLTVTDHLKSSPGLDIAQGGLLQSNVVARGFNNIFSGSLLMLQDYRFAGVPSLRVNVPYLFTGANEDIERIEVLLGPASALYGPNSANGVMHVITRSPFTSLGTSVTLDGGSQSVLRASVRHAAMLGSNLAFKLSTEYLRGDDFRYFDPGEPSVFPAAAPPGRAGELNMRSFDVERVTGEARLDWRGAGGAEAVTTIGWTNVLNGIELTGANGAAQIRGWTYTNVQQRYRRGRLFAQVFGNFSNAGADDTLSLDGTFLLRTGQPIVDRSRVFAAQLQYGFDAGGSNFTYGADYIFTNPRTGNTINGRHEDIDNVNEYGAYIQGTTPLTDRWDFVPALRADRHSELDGVQISPRAALVFKPTPNHNVRATYNRAFQTPANFAYFLDLVQRRNAGGSGFDIRVVGNHGGRMFDRSCAGAAFGSFCMRSIYNGSALTPASANEAFNGLIAQRATTFQGLIQLALSQNPQLGPLAPQLATAIVNGLQAANPTSADLTTRVAYLLAPGANITPDQVRDIGALKASFNNSYELGYKGLIGASGRLSVDVWAQERGDVTPPAGVATPSVFFNGANLGTYLGANVVSTLVPIFMSPQGGGMSEAQARATAEGVANQLVPQVVPVLAQAPLGTITFADETRSDVLFTYFALGNTITVYGLDIGYDWALTRNFSVGGTYSWQSENTFDEVVFSAVQGGNGLPYMSNSPKNKASLSVRYETDGRRVGVEVRGRYADPFPVNSSLYSSGVEFDDPDTDGTYTYPPVPTNITLDAGVTWRLPVPMRDIMWSLNGTNILDNKRPTFVGTPAIGRMIMTRLSYTF